MLSNAAVRTLNILYVLESVTIGTKIFIVDKGKDTYIPPSAFPVPFR